MARSQSGYKRHRQLLSELQKILFPDLGKSNRKIGRREHSRQVPEAINFENDSNRKTGETRMRGVNQSIR